MLGVNVLAPLNPDRGNVLESEGIVALRSELVVIVLVGTVREMDPARRSEVDREAMVPERKAPAAGDVVVLLEEVVVVMSWRRRDLVERDVASGLCAAVVPGLGDERPAALRAEAEGASRVVRHGDRERVEPELVAAPPEGAICPCRGSRTMEP